MTTMGFYQARTHLSEVLDRVEKGKTILITRRGKPVALIGPPPRENQQNVSQIVEKMLAFRNREGPTLGRQITLRKLIDEGRRF
jgi:antitoxin (DNA-binding transcriptional repressor) of toxin-antitoxin stability system